jgi:P-type E1-E2 ATPase
LVPGDLIRIKLGEFVPADARFIDGENISIDRATLTGESLPADKKIDDEGYSGSIAKKGEMTAVVTATTQINAAHPDAACVRATPSPQQHSGNPRPLPS